MKFSEVEEWKIPEGDVYQVKDKKTGHVLWRKKLNLTLTASPAEGGACYTPGKYFYNSTVAVNAVPTAGYKFLKWDDENTNASREITMTEDMSYVAIFQQDILTGGTWKLAGLVKDPLCIDAGEPGFNMTGSLLEWKPEDGMWYHHANRETAVTPNHECTWELQYDEAVGNYRLYVNFKSYSSTSGSAIPEHDYSIERSYTAEEVNSKNLALKGHDDQGHGILFDVQLKWSA